MGFFDYASVFSLLIPTVCALFYYKSFPTSLRLLTLVLVLGSSVDFWCIYAVKHSIHTFPVQNLYSIFETLFLTLMLFFWKKTKWFRVVAVMLLVIYLFFWFYSIITLGIDSYAGGAYTMKSIFMMILLSGILIDISFDLSIPVYKNYKFWIGISLLFYYSIGVVLWSTAFLPIGDYVIQYYSWNIHAVLSIFTNLLVTYGLITFVRWKAIYV